MKKKIIIKRTLSPEEKITLKGYFPLTRKYAFFLLQESNLPLSAICKKCSFINRTEINIISIWKNKMLGKMRHRHFENVARFYFKRLQEPEPNLERILTQAEKTLANLEGETKQILETKDELQVFISLIKGYKKKIHMFNEKGFELLVKEGNIEKFQRWLHELDVQEEIDDENRLFILQTLKHINILHRHNIMPGYDLLKIALNSKYADDAELLNAQALLVNNCYDENNFTEAAMRIRNLCYDFIRGSIKTANYFHPSLVLFLFKGNWISEQTFQLLMAAKEAVFKNGMQAFVQMYIKKSYEQVLLKQKISAEDTYVIQIARAYEII